MNSDETRQIREELRAATGRTHDDFATVFKKIDALSVTISVLQVSIARLEERQPVALARPCDALKTHLAAHKTVEARWWGVALRIIGTVIIAAGGAVLGIIWKSKTP